MVKEDILKQTEDFVKSCSINNEPGHDFYHILRVRNMALLLGKECKSDILSCGRICGHACEKALKGVESTGSGCNSKGKRNGQIAQSDGDPVAHSL